MKCELFMCIVLLSLGKIVYSLSGVLGLQVMQFPFFCICLYLKKRKEKKSNSKLSA